MSEKKVKYIPAELDGWVEAYAKEYVSGPYKNKPDTNLLPEEAYTYIKKNNLISDTPRFKRDAKKED